jgi:hypothetical protein
MRSKSMGYPSTMWGVADTRLRPARWLSRPPSCATHNQQHPKEGRALTEDVSGASRRVTASSTRVIRIRAGLAARAGRGLSFLPLPTDGVATQHRRCLRTSTTGGQRKDPTRSLAPISISQVCVLRSPGSKAYGSPVYPATWLRNCCSSRLNSAGFSN